MPQQPIIIWNINRILKSYTEVFSLHNHIRKYFYYIIIVLKEIKSVLMMATERKKVVTDKFIHNLINISDEKQAKVQKVYFLESQYFIVPSHHNISCMWLTASLDILIIENFTDLFKNIFCIIKTWWFFLPFNWLKENNKLSSSKSNLPWFI